MQQITSRNNLRNLPVNYDVSERLEGISAVKQKNHTNQSPSLVNNCVFKCRQLFPLLINLVRGLFCVFPEENVPSGAFIFNNGYLKEPDFGLFFGTKGPRPNCGVVCCLRCTKASYG